MSTVEYHLAHSGGRRACPHPQHRFARVPNSPSRVILPECAGREAWLAARLDGIGGSEVGALIGVNEYETTWSIWKKKTATEPDKELTGAPIEWGHRLEDVVAEKTAEEIGLASRFGGGLWAMNEKPHIRVTPDRLATKPRSWTALGIIECKGLPLETPIPVPSGWSSIQEIRTGDELFAADGTVCRVTGKSEVRWVDCYRLTFDDGSSIVCDADHRWPVVSGRADRAKSQVLDTRQIAESLVGPNGQKQHRILLAGALDMPDDLLLPVEPYTLGCWLGDGTVNSGRISKPDQEMFDHITAASGLQVAPVPADVAHGKCPTRTIYGLVRRLRDAGVLENRHVPARYLRASREQRLSLLQGLMDSDGTSTPSRKQVSFSSTTKQLAYDVEELALSLGERPVIVEAIANGFGKQVTVWRVQWRPNKVIPFRLSRKADKTTIEARYSRSGQRVIISAEPTVTVPTQCLMVDSIDHTYLCDRTFLPTHNTAGDGEHWESGTIRPKSHGTGAAPLSYQAQLQWQMGILGLKIGWLGCYVSNMARDFFTVEVHFDAEWFAEMVHAADVFWHDNVKAGVVPMHDLRHPITEDLLKAEHPEVIRPSVQLPEDAEDWLVNYERAKRAAEVAEANLAEAKNFFRMWTGDAGAAYLGEDKVVSYPVINPKKGTIDVAKLREEFPEAAEACTVRNPHRRLTISVPKDIKAKAAEPS